MKTSECESERLKKEEADEERREKLRMREMFKLGKSDQRGP
jgi:hypothetical protein